MTNIYIATEKSTGELVSGRNGQFAFGTKGALGTSMYYVFERNAKLLGVKPKELYDVHSITSEQFVAMASGKGDVLQVTELIQKPTDENGYKGSLSISVHMNDIPQAILHFQDGEIEDNTTMRNFSDIHRISALLLMAYEAGKNGLEFEYDSIVEGLFE